MTAAFPGDRNMLSDYGGRLRTIHILGLTGDHSKCSISRNSKYRVGLCWVPLGI
ncbi:hypothetical protein M413DRAFT_443447 [Hebeloma cylindrosporum]|uniref:Uncharacterized protein n=1 Tax=Hebeloma cylindrosporum TaxID=76867 RepID=A0A0C2YR46_HEBCY|nr:hypothetical protein M413DRAFT_443447 [Hebeloma cylindrosporum h7]